MFHPNMDPANVRIARALGPKSHVFARFGRVRFFFPLSATRPAFSDFHASLAPRSSLLICYHSLIIATLPLSLILCPSLPRSSAHTTTQTRPSLCRLVIASAIIILPLFHPVNPFSSVISLHQSRPMPPAIRDRTWCRLLITSTAFRHHCRPYFAIHQSNSKPLASRRLHQRRSLRPCRI
jgi:hypothetical protein